MVNLMGNSGEENVSVLSFVIDNSAEIANLPNSTSKNGSNFPLCGQGSTCFCINTSSAYMLDGNDNWVLI